MKYKTTAKALREGACNLRSAGYCDLQYLLTNHSPVAYTCGVYGWNFDVYEVYGLTICTGYRGMPGERLEGIAEAEEKARLEAEQELLDVEEDINNIEEINVDEYGELDDLLLDVFFLLSTSTPI